MAETARKIYRCESHDYAAPCIYEITLSLADWRSAALGQIVVDARDDQGVPIAAHCALSPLGQSVAACWEAISRFHPEIKVIGKQVMPEHFHGLLWVQKRLPCQLGQVIKGFKAGCNQAARALNLLNVRGGLWQEGFQDTILRHEGQLANMMRYLGENPIRRAIKMANPQLFHQVALLKVSGLAFSALGNRHLLERPLQQVQCSRRFFTYARQPDAGGARKIAKDAAGEPIVAQSTPEYEARHDALLEAARHGAVLISPCISDGERQIAREALRLGLPLIALRNMGFDPLEKPSGRLFAACAAGRYLMLAPAAWPYRVAQKPMTREDATALNRLCQYLAGDGAAEINYHGLQPFDVDALAKAAATARGGAEAARKQRLVVDDSVVHTEHTNTNKIRR